MSTDADVQKIRQFCSQLGFHNGPMSKRAFYALPWYVQETFLEKVFDIFEGFERYSPVVKNQAMLIYLNVLHPFKDLPIYKIVTERHAQKIDTLRRVLSELNRKNGTTLPLPIAQKDTTVARAAVIPVTAPILEHIQLPALPTIPSSSPAPTSPTLSSKPVISTPPKPVDWSKITAAAGLPIVHQSQRRARPGFIKGAAAASTAALRGFKVASKAAARAAKTTRTRLSRSTASTKPKKLYPKKFQRRDEPEDPLDPLVLFYKSLYKEKKGNSPLAITWLTEYGIGTGDAREMLEQKYEQLKQANQLIK